MDQILELPADTEQFRITDYRITDRSDTADAPKPEWVRGTCPQCGAPLVSNLYYVGGKGYLCIWDCWRSLDLEPACTYRRVI